MAERGDERLARHIVSTVFAVPVTRHEDGTRASQVDALIHFATGDAALEIVGDHDADFNSQWQALERTGRAFTVPDLTSAWSVSLKHSANVKRLKQQLPVLLRAHEQTFIADEPRANLPKEFDSLGVIGVYRSSSGSPGQVTLRSGGWAGFANSISLSEWTERQLDIASDVPHKLKLHPAREKHAFIWITMGSDYAIQSILENRGQSDPTEPLHLPDGVTHVWVATGFTSGGVLAWFPDRGWWRTPWEWPPDGKVHLPVD